MKGMGQLTGEVNKVRRKGFISEGDAQPYTPSTPPPLPPPRSSPKKAKPKQILQSGKEKRWIINIVLHICTPYVYVLLVSETF